MPGLHKLLPEFPTADHPAVLQWYSGISPCQIAILLFPAVWEFYYTQKHIPDYLPVYLLSGGFDNLTKNGKDTIKLYQILKGNGLKDLQYKIYDNKRQDILHDNNYRDVYHDIMHWLDERTYI